MPLTKTSSPGLSSQPASSEPSITVSAPATSALAMSPEYCRPPSPIDRDAGRPARQRRLVDRGDLRDADAGDDAGRADRARPDADLDGVDAGVDERLRAGAGGDVAADHLDVPGGRVGLEPADHVEQQPGVAVGGVDDEHVDAGLDQRRGALPGVAEVADRRADQQPAVGVLGGVRELLGLHEVLDGDEPGEPALVVDQRQLLELVLAQQRGRVVAADARPGAVTSGIGVMTSRTSVVRPLGDRARSAGRGW